MSWNESEPQRVDVGTAHIYITADANLQWDMVELEVVAARGIPIHRAKKLMEVV